MNNTIIKRIIILGTMPKRDIVRKRTANYYVVNVDGPINETNLEFFLQKEFESKGSNVNSNHPN